MGGIAAVLDRFNNERSPRTGRPSSKRANCLRYVCSSEPIIIRQRWGERGSQHAPGERRPMRRSSCGGQQATSIQAMFGLLFCFLLGTTSALFYFMLGAKLSFSAFSWNDGQLLSHGRSAPPNYLVEVSSPAAQKPENQRQLAHGSQ